MKIFMMIRQKAAAIRQLLFVLVSVWIPAHSQDLNLQCTGNTEHTGISPHISNSNSKSVSNGTSRTFIFKNGRLVETKKITISPTASEERSYYSCSWSAAKIQCSNIDPITEKCIVVGKTRHEQAFCSNSLVIHRGNGRVMENYQLDVNYEVIGSVLRIITFNGTCEVFNQKF